MGFSATKEITLNTVFLYRAGDILVCPVCKTEHYRALRDIFQGDHMVSSQLECLLPIREGKEPELSEYCHKCFGGDKVALVAMFPGMMGNV